MTFKLLLNLSLTVLAMGVWGLPLLLYAPEEPTL